MRVWCQMQTPTGTKARLVRDSGKGIAEGLYTRLMVEKEEVRGRGPVPCFPVSPRTSFRVLNLWQRVLAALSSTIHTAAALQSLSTDTHYTKLIPMYHST
ncbi:hypothetical protein CBL_03649 [Carabus blaptoides fortunei]